MTLAEKQERMRRKYIKPDENHYYSIHAINNPSTELPLTYDPKGPMSYTGKKLLSAEQAKRELSHRKQSRAETQKAKEHKARTGIGCLAEAIAQFPGGLKTFIPFVFASSTREESFTPLVNAFMKLRPIDQNAFKLEEMCVDLGLSPHHLLGVCVEIASELKHDTTRMLAYLAMPQVMKRNIKEALKTKGVEDRKMFMQSTGILPVPKGSTINVAQTQSLTNQGEPTGLPAFEDSTVSFSEVIRRAVETPQAALPEPIEAEVEE
jgi:hypothetical protein